MTRTHLVRRVAAVASGVCAGIAAGFLLTDGEPVVLLVAVLATVIALGASYLVLPANTRPVMLPLTLAILLRVAVAVVMYDGLVAAGRAGFVTGDDAVYADLSARLARILHGESAPFYYPGESYLLGTFVYLETAVFYVLGPNVLLVELLNAAMGGLLATFAFDIARRLFLRVETGVIAAVVVALYPSLVLWSALNLKDSLVLLLITLVLWLLVLFQARSRWWLVPVTYVALFPMDSLRNYIFVGLALIIPISVALSPRGTIRERAATTAIAISLSLLFLAIQTNPTGGIRSASDFDAERSGMAVGANTSFADQPPAVRVAYVLFAPFPWSPRRALDLLATPEMVIWYAALAGAALTVLRHFRSWRTFAPFIMFIGGTLLVLWLVEGNVGTLFRHRAMVVPLVLILAAPSFAIVLTERPRQSGVAQPTTWATGRGQPERPG